MVNTAKQEIINKPSIKVVFKLDTPVYKLTKGGLERIPNKHLKRGTEYPAKPVAGKEGCFEVDGQIIKECVNNPFKILYGNLFINKDEVNVLSKNGTILRKVHKGQTFKILEIKNISNNLFSYMINNREMILSQQGVIVKLF